MSVREQLQEAAHAAAATAAECTRDCEFELADFYRGKAEGLREALALLREAKKEATQ